MQAAAAVQQVLLIRLKEAAAQAVVVTVQLLPVAVSLVTARQIQAVVVVVKMTQTSYNQPAVLAVLE
jgi:hypothetical protein